MSREWKPGDVACVNGAMAVRHFDNISWFTSSGRLSDPNVAYAYPRVVIDPEDRDDVERLHAAREKAIAAEIARVGSAQTVDALQDALRSLVESPTPDEPLGLGAVAEDVDGDIWVRFEASSGPWWRNKLLGSRQWRDLDVVRVLSDGWEGER